MKTEEPRLQIGAVYTNPEGKRRKLAGLLWCGCAGGNSVEWTELRRSGESRWVGSERGWLKWLTKGTRKHGRTWTV